MREQPRATRRFLRILSCLRFAVAGGRGWNLLSGRRLMGGVSAMLESDRCQVHEVTFKVPETILRSHRIGRHFFILAGQVGAKGLHGQSRQKT